MSIFKSLFSTKEAKTVIPDGLVETGTQQSLPEGFAFLYKAPQDYLELYRQLFDNVPILESAVDVYVHLINPGWNLIGEDGQALTENLKQIGFNEKLNDAIQSAFIYGFSGMEIVMSDDLKSILRFVSLPSEKIRIQVDPQANIIKYYQLGSGTTMGNHMVRTMGPPGVNKTKMDEKVGGIGSPMIELNPLTFLLLNRSVKDGDPYGRSLYKSMPFITKIMLEIQDSMGKIYKKYGSPRFHVNYIPKNELSEEKLKERLNSIKSKFNDPKIGQDFFSAGDIKIDVIGASNEKMAFSIETAEIMQAVFSGLKLPAGMLGYNYGSTETHLSGQIEVLLARLYNYQEHFETLINRQLMPLVAKVYGLNYLPIFEFEATTMRDEAADEALETNKINNALTLLNSGFITIEQAQERLELPINPNMYKELAKAQEEANKDEKPDTEE